METAACDRGIAPAYSQLVSHDRAWAYALDYQPMLTKLNASQGWAMVTESVRVEATLQLLQPIDDPCPDPTPNGVQECDGMNISLSQAMSSKVGGRQLQDCSAN